MTTPRPHTFHIPVLGLAFSIDTPIRVARFGISSVISIVDDILIEHMRKHYSEQQGETYQAITVKEHDSRAKRITAYLDLVHRIVQQQVDTLKATAFEKGSEIVRYFELLPEQSPLKVLYRKMLQTRDATEKLLLQNELRDKIVPGVIDVNIMTKLDKTNLGPDKEPLPPEYCDAVASLRGFVKSIVNSSVVLSAGLNPRLYSYMGQCPEFLPDEQGHFKKRVILKVSDFRSALIQGKFLAKRGIWISEFRIESGLNCGGHAFATDGYLLGPILEEFKVQRRSLHDELSRMYYAALKERGALLPSQPLPIRITVQGGIGTAKENAFLQEYYEVDGTGWGSPFLLVPEATNVDDATRTRLAEAGREDFYLSNASPLGIPFNNVRGSSSEQSLLRKVKEGRPGSPCTKKFLTFNTEFTKEPICTASRQYQHLKTKQLEAMNLPDSELLQRLDAIHQKACLCEDLAAAGFITTDHTGTVTNHPVAVCPGPNLAYFTRIVSLEEMVGHIYGRLQSLVDSERPHMFITELEVYVQYFKDEVQKRFDALNAKEQKYLDSFRANLEEGIAYYKELIPKLAQETERYREKMHEELLALEEELLAIVAPYELAHVR
jgi:hypothetical protein